MSRIEKALERAALLRSGQTKTISAGTTAPALPAECTTGSFHPNHPCIVSLQDRHTPVAEQYRKLKAAVLKSTQKEFRNLIMVTSSLAGEGKSITAANLGIMMAQELNQTVLLVDADLRRPALQRYLNVSPARGLTDCLADGLDAGDAIIGTGMPKLSFLGTGRKVNNPAELLTSFRMKEFLQELKHRYRDRYVIIDTPPVVPFAETHAICLMVDGVIFVVREGMVSQRAISDALESLHGSQLLGLVYNDASNGAFAGPYGYYGSYSPVPGGSVSDGGVRSRSRETAERPK